MSVNRKRVALNLEQKISIISAIESGRSRPQLQLHLALLA